MMSDLVTRKTRVRNNDTPRDLELLLVLEPLLERQRGRLERIKSESEEHAGQK